MAGGEHRLACITLAANQASLVVLFNQSKYAISLPRFFRFPTDHPACQLSSASSHESEGDVKSLNIRYCLIFIKITMNCNLGHCLQNQHFTHFYLHTYTGTDQNETFLTYPIRGKSTNQELDY
jgi:hypothetical protein